MTYIELCQEAYYSGNPLITNEEYDVLAKALGEESIGRSGDIEHYERMWSLDKKYTCRGDSLPSNMSEYIETPKLDGCAVSLLFYKGNFIRGLTRGNGVKGKDVTKNLVQLLPLYDGRDSKFLENDFVQITGEVCTTKQVQNQRNFASGAVNTLDPLEFKNRIIEGGLVFVAYNTSIELRSYEEEMEWVFALGFDTVCDNTFNPSNTILDNIPKDGIVYRLNNSKDFKDAGYTAKFPKGAFALKEDEEGVPATLLDITWSTGKSGKVVPTAIFSEVVIDDAKITRATLHNPEFIDALGITDIGQTIYIIRSGGIIPCIVSSDPFEG